MKIGVDIRGVLIGKGKDIDLFSVPNSLQSLQLLSKKNLLYIISYSKENMAQYNYTRLADYDLFWTQYYVSDKSYKSSVVNYLGCDVMIDDNENILNIVKQNKPGVITILFQRYNKQKKQSHRHHYIAGDWLEVMNIVESLEIDNYSTDLENKGLAYYISQ
jgi:hypothetical protein